MPYRIIPPGRHPPPQRAFRLKRPARIVQPFSSAKEAIKRVNGHGFVVAI
jgi:hypothetical protein